MNLVYVFLLGSVPFVLVVFAWMCSRQATYHQGKSDAFRKVSNDFRGLSDATWMRDKAKQKAKREQAWLSLCLCDPKVCDALDEALTEAREHWKHPKVAA